MTFFVVVGGLSLCNCSTFCTVVWGFDKICVFCKTNKQKNKDMVPVPADSAQDLASSAPGLWEPSFSHVSKGSQVVLCSSSAVWGQRYNEKKA